MTRTDHLQLYRWSPEDFVDLEQVNANFDALERVGGNYDRAAETLRHHLAHDALYRYHKGMLAPRLRDLVTVDLSKPSGETENLVQLQDVYGTPMLVPSIEPSFSAQTAELSVNPNSSTTVCTFTPTGYGRVTSLTLPAPKSANMSDVCVGIVEGSNVLWESEPLAFTSQQVQTVAADCPIAVGHTYTVRIRRTTEWGVGLWVLSAGSCAVTVSGSVYGEGSFTTKAFSLSGGSVLDLWVYYTGDAPALACSLDGGEWAALSLSEPEAAVTVEGGACLVRRCRLANVDAQTLRVRFTLTSSDTLVRELCGALL